MNYRRSLVVIFLMLAASPSRAEQATIEQRVMGIAMATIEYCPGIKIRDAVVTTLGAAAKTWLNYDAAEESKAAAFKLLRSASSREAACDLMMTDYGPGSELSLFQFK